MALLRLFVTNKALKPASGCTHEPARAGCCERRSGRAARLRGGGGDAHRVRQPRRLDQRPRRGAALAVPLMPSS
eukprot:6192653-Pleurochrysis_carterae.AAC.1